MKPTIGTYTLSYTEFKKFVIDSANWFTPSLHEMPNLNDWILKMYQNGRIHYFISRNCIISLAVTYENAEQCLIYIPYICVHPRFQGGGIGIQIINHIIENRSLNIHSIYLEVRKDNFHANELYRKIGFYNVEDRGEKYLLKKDL